MENDALELEPNESAECGHCGDTFDRDDATETDDGPVCTDCAPDYVATADGNHVCHIDNVANCDYCEESYRDRDLTAVIDSRHNHANVCDGCMYHGYNSFVEPEDEGGLWDADGLYYSEGRDAYFVNPPRDGLLDYDANVLDFTGHNALVNGKVTSLRNNKALVMGVELEIDTRGINSAHDIADTIGGTSFSNYGISKSDATCSGPELVTMPADLFSHKHTMQWSEWCETLREVARGYHGRDNGMHVHVNKLAISPLTLGKILVFMNSRKNAAFLSMVAQRDVTENEWCQVNGAFFDKVGKSGKIRDNGDQPHGKYSIANVTDSTLEIRMFKSTLLPERLLKNLEFCAALVMWAKRASAARLTTDSLIGYIKEYRKEYPNLHKFITDRREA